MPASKKTPRKAAPRTKKSAAESNGKKAKGTKAKSAGAAKAKEVAATKRETLMTAKQLSAAIAKIADELHEEFPTQVQLMILGIRTRGVIIADRLKALLEKHYDGPVATGILDITFYRDDLSRLGPIPTVHGSEIPFDVTGAYVVLVDDVVFTGRTIRAAMDEICDFGRPALIRLVALVDRGLREFPIQPDYCALKIETNEDQQVDVMLEETDDEERVVLVSPK